MQTLWQGLCYGARKLPKKSGFILIAFITLALSIRADTVILDEIQVYASKPQSSQTPEQASVIPGSTKLFEFHSGFWVNLHHFLYLQASERMKTQNKGRQTIAEGSSDIVAVRDWSTEDRRRWEAALDYYKQNMISLDLVFDDHIIAISDSLARRENSFSLQSVEIDSALKQILESAAEIYRSRWWTQHDQANRDWAKMIDPLLKKYGGGLSQKIVESYRTTWPATPFRVDLCIYAGWPGAYTTTTPARITLASGDPRNKDLQGLEILFHESLHVLEKPLVAELRRQATAQGKQLPDLLSHAFIFFTAGEILKQTVPDHKPYAEVNKIWARKPWNGFRELLDLSWRPYINRKVGFEDAVKSIVKAL